MVDRDLKTSHEVVLGRCPLPGSIWSFNDPQSLLHDMRIVVEEAVVQDTGKLWVRFLWENERRNTLPVDRFLQTFIPGL